MNFRTVSLALVFLTALWMGLSLLLPNTPPTQEDPIAKQLRDEAQKLRMLGAHITQRDN